MWISGPFLTNQDRPQSLEVRAIVTSTDPDDRIAELQENFRRKYSSDGLSVSIGSIPAGGLSRQATLSFAVNEFHKQHRELLLGSTPLNQAQGYLYYPVRQNSNDDDHVINKLNKQKKTLEEIENINARRDALRARKKSSR